MKYVWLKSRKERQKRKMVLMMRRSRSGSKTVRATKLKDKFLKKVRFPSNRDFAPKQILPTSEEDAAFDLAIMLIRNIGFTHLRLNNLVSN